MKKFFKNILATAVATAMCLSVNSVAFADENSKKVNTETTKHIATLYEPEEREHLEVNTLYRMIGNVATEASPSIATNKNTTIMAFSDVDDATTLSFDESSEESSSRAAITVTRQAAMYSTFNKDKNVWNVPKYIHPSSSDWSVGGVVLKSDGENVYAVCLESRTIQLPETGLLDLKFPDTQIAIHRYDTDTQSFAPIKLFASDGNSCYLMPGLVSTEDTTVITWLSIPKISISDFLSKEIDVTCCYSKYVNGNWSEVKELTTMPCRLTQNAIAPYVSGTVNGKLAFVFNVNENNKGYITIKDENNNTIYKQEGVFDLVVNGKTETDKDGFYFVENGELFTITGSPASKLVVAKNLNGIVDLCISNSGNIFYATQQKPNIVSKIKYDAKDKRYGNVVPAANASSKVIGISVAEFSGADMLTVLTAGMSDEIKALNKIDSENCGANLYYILCAEKAVDVPVKGEPTTKHTDAKDTDKTQNDYVPPYSEKETIANEETPSTGSKFEFGALAALGLAIITLSKFKKRKTK